MDQDGDDELEDDEMEVLDEEDNRGGGDGAQRKIER